MDALLARNFAGCTMSTYTIFESAKNILLISSFHMMNRDKFSITTNKKLSSFFPTINSECIQKDCVGSISFMTTIYICSRVDRAMMFPEIGGRRHMHELVSLFKGLPNLFNRHPGKERMHGGMIDFRWSVDTGLDGSHCLFQILGVDIVLSQDINHTLVYMARNVLI